VPTKRSKNNKRFGALILAAGLSSRMDGYKPLLEINEKKFIEHALELFKNAGVEEIVTVVGFRAENLIPIIEAASSRYVVNNNYQNGMFSSIQKGVAELRNICDAFFLLPVDIPCVRSTTIQLLLKAFELDSSILVWYPEFQSRRGHPPLLASYLIDHIIAYTGNEGMRGFLRGYENRAVSVPVADPFVLRDVDTAEDLSKLKEELSKFSF